MSLYYCLIARGATVLCHHTDSSGNFQQISVSILQRISLEQNTKCSYLSDGGYQFHVVVENKLIYLCLADEAMGKRVPYAFLEEIKRRFTAGSLVSRAAVCNAYELQRDFGQVLSSQMARYNRGDFTSTDHVDVLRKEVEEVKGIMTTNVEKVLDRGVKLEVLVDKAEDLQESSRTFKKNTDRVYRKMWWQDKKMCIILTALILLIIGAIVIIVLAVEGVF